MGCFAVVAVVGLAGCQQIFGLEAPALGDAVFGDAPSGDSRPDTPPGQTCLGSGLYVVCYPDESPPTGTFAVSADMILDTSLDQSCDRIAPQANGPALCIKEKATITISSILRATGTRPLVIVATEQIVIKGVIDVASASSPGSGANAGFCSTSGAGTEDLQNGASGGGGGGGAGSFGGSGGNGGSGAVGGGGGASGIVTVTSIRGGCPGARGGRSNDGVGGSGGSGGGAIYLIAGASIIIEGTINASGQHGFGGPNKAGGGGAGSGGLIGLDANSLMLQPSAKLFANGGGGGEGGGAGVAGGDGQDPQQPGVAALGGTGNSSGGNGGDGSVLTTMGQTGGTGANGGGGGGGGAGYIKIYSMSITNPGATISPPPT